MKLNGYFIFSSSSFLPFPPCTPPSLPFLSLFSPSIHPSACSFLIPKTILQKEAEVEIEERKILFAGLQISCTIQYSEHFQSSEKNSKKSPKTLNRHTTGKSPSKISSTRSLLKGSGKRSPRQEISHFRNSLAEFKQDAENFREDSENTRISLKTEIDELEAEIVAGWMGCSEQVEEKGFPEFLPLTWMEK
jgi:hypothetical protein